MPTLAAAWTDAALVASIAWLYLLTNVLRVFTFVPQILLIWRSGNGARDVSLLTWGWWLVSHVFAVLYGVLVIHDMAFVLIALINLVGCTVVVALTGQRRRQWRRCAGQPTLPASHGSTA